MLNLMILTFLFITIFHLVSLNYSVYTEDKAMTKLHFRHSLLLLLDLKESDSEAHQRVLETSFYFHRLFLFCKDLKIAILLTMTKDKKTKHNGNVPKGKQMATIRSDWKYHFESCNVTVYKANKKEFCEVLRLDMKNKFTATISDAKSHGLVSPGEPPTSIPKRS